MLKNFRVDKAIRETVNRIARKTITRIKEKYGDINGKEEDITSKLEPKLGEELVDEIEKQLNGKNIKGLSFEIYTYKKKQEHLNGADIYGSGRHSGKQ